MPLRMTAELDVVRVVVVDDDEEDYLLTSDLFAKLEGSRHELSWIPDYGSALRSAGEQEYDVWLVDYRLGPDDGIQLVRELVATGYDMPIIVLTGRGDHVVDVEAARA